MSDATRDPASAPLPDNPSLEWLRKQSKRRLDLLRQTNPSAQLADAQFALARHHGFASWRALKAHIDSLTVDGQLFKATRDGDVDAVRALLDAYPDKLHVRTPPYGGTLLHLAARHLPVVDLLLARGLDVNAREGGDNTYAMHWAAAAGALDAVRRLAEAGGDVVGSGDDHQLEVIGWATCWDECDDDAHRVVADFLVSRGAKHHIFSAIALNLADEVRRIVADDGSALNRRMSRNENHQLPLHFAVRRNRAEMVSLLLDLGADPLGRDGDGFPVAAYATRPDVDRLVMEAIAAMTSAELVSAERGHRPPNVSMLDLVAGLSLRKWETASKLLDGNPGLIGRDAAAAGALHLLAKRNDEPAVRWLLERGADPNALWAHWDSRVTPLHLAIMQGHRAMTALLLEAGADPHIRDSRHESDALSWARFFKRSEIIRMLEK